MADDGLIDAFGVPEFFCEALARIDQVGSCRRLVFTISERSQHGTQHAPVVKLVFPAEVMANLAQVLAADVALQSGQSREFSALSLAVAN
jgi:hypothetical protein